MSIGRYFVGEVKAVGGASSGNMIVDEARMNGARPGEGYWKVLAVVKPPPTPILKFNDVAISR